MSSIEIKEILAKPISFGTERALTEIKYIVIHFTGNKGDTAENNGKYFATSNTRQSGAHFFVDKQGKICRSIRLNKIAWSVGGFFTKENGAGTYYQKCTNANSVSIELCDCLKGASWEQMKATSLLVQYIQRKCPNAKTIIRHWDVNGKQCPGPMTGTGNKKWKRFHSFLTKGYQFKAKVVKKAAVRSSGKVTPTNKIGTVKFGKIVTIEKVAGRWGRLKGKTEDGKHRWISLRKIKEL